MDESCSVKEVFKNEKTSPKIIRISKVFKKNNNLPENIMILTKGNNKIQYNLSHKVNKRNILESLKTQNTPKDEKLKSQLYYSSFKYPNTDNVNGNIRTFHMQLNSEKINKEENTLQQNINNNNYLNQNINDINVANLDEFDLPKKEMKTSIENKDKKKVFFPGMRLIDNKESERQLLKKRTLNSNIEAKNEKDIFFSINEKYNYTYTKNIASNITTRKQKTNLHNFLARKQMTYENSEKMESNPHGVDGDNGVDKASGLIFIKNKKNLIENVNLSDIVDKYSKNFVNDKQCTICERTYSNSKKIFSAKCNTHFFCKECLRMYFKSSIDKGIRKNKCPIYKCKYDIDRKILEQILDIKYCHILFCPNNIFEEEKNTIVSEKLYDNNINNLIAFQNKNVFKYNSKLNLYNIKKLGNEYCPKCHEPSLFCLTFNYFNKCLNCGYKCCKYCDKAYTSFHLIINDPRHCKVYYRKKALFPKNNICFYYAIELLYVIGIYFILHIYILTKNKLFLLLFGIDKNKYNKKICVLFLINFFIYFFNCLIYLMILPFLIILIPFFPIFIALFDGF